MCKCPLHADRSPSFSVNLEKGVWTCHAGCGGGDIIDLVAKLHDITKGDAIKMLAGPRARESATAAPRTLPTKKTESSANVEQRQSDLKLVATYDYHNATGEVKFQVLRYEPKTFRQRKVNPDGTHEWSMDGVERVPYNLPAVMAAKTVCVVEGEKDVESLRELGMAATCNPGGAKKWLPSYSTYLQGKGVFIIPDNDDPGKEHAKQVLESLQGKVEWVKWMELPKERNGIQIKDTTDYLKSFPSKKDGLEAMIALEKESRMIQRGVESDIYSMTELVWQYQQNARANPEPCLDLKRFLPSLPVRPLVRGDLMGVMGATGNLKTAFVQNALQCNGDKAAMMFEIELATDLWVERSLSIATRLENEKVEEMLKNGQQPKWQMTNRLNNLFTCLKSNVSMKYVDEQLERASAKIGAPVDIFCIDYIQLIRGAGSRYERVSDAAEEAKVLAKKWNCVGIILSQVKRPEKKATEDKVREISLEDAKESGSIENSCGLIIGVWKDSKTTMKARILKNTKGTSGALASMDISPSLHITESAPRPSR